MSTVELPAGIRDATVDDAADILRLVRELADLRARAGRGRQHAPSWWSAGSSVTTRSPLRWSRRSTARWSASRSGTAATRPGPGCPGIYLEDLFVEPEHRGHGFGKAFLVALARIALDRGYQRFEWVVLDWNTPAIEFYDALGGRPMQQWTTYRVDGERLAALGRADVALHRHETGRVR